MPAAPAARIVTAVVVFRIPPAAAPYDHSPSGILYGFVTGTPISVPIALCCCAVVPTAGFADTPKIEVSIGFGTVAELFA